MNRDRLRAVRALVRPLALLGAVVALTPAYGQMMAGPGGIDLDAIRRDFYRAIDDPVVTEELSLRIERLADGPWEAYPATVGAYAAALEGLLGKHSVAPVVKLRHIRSAISMFQLLAERYPGNLEVRFLRYAFYEQLPVIFEVGRHVPDDLEAVIRLLQADSPADVPVQVRVDMIGYILGTSPPDATQRTELAAVRERLAATAR